MYTYEFKPQAVKDLQKLPKEMQQRIINKLDFFVSSNNPLNFADHLINSEIGQYRFRIGDYRVIFDLEDTKIIVLLIGHRREIYK